MIKRIPVAKLIPGMFIHSLNCDWIEHDFLRSAFAVRDEAMVARVHATGVDEIYIDTQRGADVDDADDFDTVLPHAARAAAAPRSEDGDETPAGPALRTCEGPAPAPSGGEAPGDGRRRLDGIADDIPAFTDVPAAAEIDHARALQRHAQQVVRELMAGVRLGRPIQVEKVERAVQGLVASVFRQPGALLPLVRLKKHDEYTFMHSVSTCALLANFGRTLGLSAEVIHEMSVGALLHDVGKAHIPDDILNKPTKLTDAEFEKMKTHVVQTKIILQNTPGVGPVAQCIAAEHHEHFDGSGYPNRLKGAEISRYGRMGSIVDVYDALTSDRIYRKGMPPTLALRKLLEWSGTHFDPELVHAFIRSVGIYPSGSLVRLESGKLAVIQEQNANLLHPKVLVIFDIARHAWVTPYLLDTSRGTDRVVQYEDFGQWRINAAHWLPGDHRT